MGREDWTKAAPLNTGRRNKGKREQMVNTNLAQAVDATSDSGPAYDTNVKHLLADKQILSRILKYTI